MLKLKVIACDVLNREISYLASQSQQYVDVTFISQGLHNTPERLREAVQVEINKANEGFPYNYMDTCPNYDYIVIGYGLCSNGIVGITSPKIPLVIPKAHDCITMLLGSKEKFKHLFDTMPGTFWYSCGWIERGWQPSELKFTSIYNEYIKHYDEDNAEYLMELEKNWVKQYKAAGLIYWDCLENRGIYREYTKAAAQYLNWSYQEIQGDEGLLKSIFSGKFNENEVLIVPAGAEVEPSYDEQIIKYI